MAKFSGTMTELSGQDSTSGDLRVVESFFTNEEGKSFDPKVRVLTAGEKGRPVKAYTRAQLRDIIPALQRFADGSDSTKATKVTKAKTTTKRRKGKSAKDAVAERAASKKGGA